MADLKKLWGSAKAPERGEFTLIPTGIYKCTVSEASIDLAKERVNLNFKIAQDGEYQGRLLFSNYTLTEKGIGYLKLALVSLGANQATVDAVASHDDLSNILKSLHGTMCEVTAKARSYTKTDGSEGHAHSVYVNDTADRPAALRSSAPVNNAPKLDSGEALPF